MVANPEINPVAPEKAQAEFNTLVETAREVAAEYIRDKKSPEATDSFYKINNAYQQLLAVYSFSPSLSDLRNAFFEAFTLNPPPESTPANTYNETRFINKVNATLARSYKTTNPNFTYTGQEINHLPTPRKENYATQVDTSPKSMVATMRQIFRAIEEEDFNQLYRLLRIDNIDINSQENRFTPLIWAVLENKPNYVQLFLKMGANPDYEGVKRESPLAIAKRLGYTEIEEILSPASKQSSDENENKALIEAIKTGNISEAERIFALQFPFVDTHEDFNTKLGLAVESESFEMVKLLVLHGASVSEPQVYSTLITFIDTHKQYVWCQLMLKLFALEKQKQLEMMNAFCLAEGNLENCQTEITEINVKFEIEVAKLSDQSKQLAHSKQAQPVIPTPPAALAPEVTAPVIALHERIETISLGDYSALEKTFLTEANSFIQLMRQLEERVKQNEFQKSIDSLRTKMSVTQTKLAKADPNARPNYETLIANWTQQIKDIELLQVNITQMTDLRTVLEREFRISSSLPVNYRDGNMVLRRNETQKKEESQIRSLTSILARSMVKLNVLNTPSLSAEDRSVLEANNAALLQEVSLLKTSGDPLLVGIGDLLSEQSKAKDTKTSSSKEQASREGVNLQLHAKVTAIGLENIAELEKEFAQSARKLIKMIEETKLVNFYTFIKEVEEAINTDQTALAIADTAQKSSLLSAIQKNQERLRAFQMVKQALPSLDEIKVQLNQSFIIPEDESKLIMRHKSTQKNTECVSIVRVDTSEKDRDEIRILTSAMNRTIEMMIDGRDIMNSKEFTPEKKAAFDANLKALAQEANVIAGKGTSGLYKLGVSLLIVAACLGVAAGLFAIIGASTGGTAILPFLAAHCEFGLTAAIMAGTSLSTGAAATLAGTTVFAAPALVAGAAGAVAFFKSEKPPSVGASLEKLTKKIEPFEKGPSKSK